MRGSPAMLEGAFSWNDKSSEKHWRVPRNGRSQAPRCVWLRVAPVLALPHCARSCALCHSEHNGPDFNLIQWDPSPKAFDHSKTGYVLEGKHAGLTCVQCHTPQHIRAAERGTILMKDLKRTFLGLSRDCLSCHRDEHRGQLGTNCLQCHTYSEWKGAPRFNHAQARYPLTGAHALVPCMKCHPTTPEPAKFVKYVGLAFEKCSACHADPHRGAFPNACESCHNTSGWHHTQAAARFDHSKTDFPLLGKHRSEEHTSELQSPCNLVCR